MPVNSSYLRDILNSGAFGRAFNDPRQFYSSKTKEKTYKNMIVHKEQHTFPFDGEREDSVNLNKIDNIIQRITDKLRNEYTDLCTIRVTESVENRKGTKYFSWIYKKMTLTFTVTAKVPIIFTKIKEDEGMPVVSKEMEKYMEDPPKDMQKRMVAHLKTFQKVLGDIREAGMGKKNDLGEKNKIEVLANMNFASHPKIHRGYYDKKDAGRLMVKDAKTKKFIAKENSILLTNGTFVSKESIKLLDLTDLATIREFASAYFGGAALKKKLKDYYMYGKDTEYTYMTVNVDELFPIITQSSLLNFIADCWRRFSASKNNILDMQTYEEVPETYLNEFYEFVSIKLRNPQEHYGDVVSSFMVIKDFEAYKPENSEFKLDKDSIFAPNSIMITGGHGGAELRTSIQRAIDQNSPVERPMLVLNVGKVHYRSYNNRPEIDRYARLLLPETEEHRVFPFNLALKTKRPLPLTHNMETRNRTGSLDNYSMRVPDVKISFLMTDKEKIYYKNSKEKPIWMGFELEVHTRTQSNQAQQEFIQKFAATPLVDHAIIKSDSSIRGNGGEIVTIPATLNYHKQMFDDHFFCAKNKFDRDVLSAPTCGLHVHIDKKAFTKLTLGKFMAFIQAPDNQTFMTAISNRSGSQYATNQSLKGKNSKGMDMSAAIGNRVNMHDRSDDNVYIRGAVNVLPKHTVEIRIFKSTNTKTNLYKKLEFCEALVKFCRMTSMQDINPYHFIKWVAEKENRKEYPYLLNWFASKDMIEYEQKKIQGKGKLIKIYGGVKVPNPKAAAAS